MTKLSQGILVLVVLIIGFALTDINGQATNQEAIPEDLLDPPVVAGPLIETEPPAISTPVPEPPAIAALLPELPPTPQPTIVSIAKPKPTEPAPPVQEKLAPADSIFDALMVPFVNESRRRRDALAKSDPEFAQRVDPTLNEGRVNFLLFGYGETHEPPATERALIGSHTIISYDLKTRRADIISLTHDIRAPEIERALVKKGWKQAPVMRLDHAYEVGGFQLMRQTLENATGLSIDFQIAFRDAAIQPLVDNVFGGIEVQVPESFDVHPFYLDGKKFEKGHFVQGRQKLNGRQVIQFIKTVPVTEGAYDKGLEHNVRKALILDALMGAINQNFRDTFFWIKGSAYVTGEALNGGVAYDFDPASMIVNNIGTTTANLRKSLAQKSSGGQVLPRIGKTRYIVDPAHGDGGVQWVGANAAVNPVTKKDMDDGVYQSTDVEIPIDANPYGNLVTDYWPSVRQVVRKALLSTEP